MTKRKFHRTIIQFEVLSEEPLGDISLEKIAHETCGGEWSGRFLDSNELEVDGKQMAGLLKTQGSDPGFFQLTEDGEDAD